MDFAYSPKVEDLRARLNAFMEAHVYPAEAVYDAEHEAAADKWQPLAIIEDLKARAKAEGLWNLFLPESDHGAGLLNHEYAPLSEIMGRVLWASEVFNCSAPDTGNMETLERYGSEAQKERWLPPLLAGQIRSAFCMTEPEVASSDATNIATRITRDGDHYVINGRKWWSSGAGDPRCAILIVMGKTDPAAETHRQQSMVLVPRDTPGVNILRMLPVFGWDDAPHGHGEIVFDNVRVPAANILLGEGRGFEIAQGRLGPGRIHHCMRAIGMCERAIELTAKRAYERHAFGARLSEQPVMIARIAEMRILLDQSRLMVLHAAWKMDQVGNKEARREIAAIKVAVPRMACQVMDWAIQAHGGGGVTNDFPLAKMWQYARTLRIVDGPDEVHTQQLGKLELRRLAPMRVNA